MIAAEGLPVRTTTRLLGVTESGYHTWRTRPPSPRTLHHTWLTRLITVIHTTTGGTYGYRRIHHTLTHHYNITVSHSTVELLMRRAGIHGRPTGDHPFPKGTGT
ncbi:IS3 family transposase [Streptomyces sp. NPDC001982]|uniref:IS3 family transposase n=1 Tax=unclassified Streptomyces TaxID=2593676 RepID=UPI00331E28DE